MSTLSENVKSPRIFSYERNKEEPEKPTPRRTESKCGEVEKILGKHKGFSLKIGFLGICNGGYLQKICSARNSDISGIFAKVTKTHFDSLLVFATYRHGEVMLTF